MKTLRNLEVTGGLFQAETTVQAAVGDAIDLYLDQTYNEDFPETIRGEIVGITLINCDVDTSYDVEYDEADLTGASYLRPEDVVDYLVLSQAGIVAADLETETAARVAGDSAESVLAVIAESTLAPAVLILPDFEDVIAPEGALGTRAGRLALGNFTDTEDFITPRRVAGIVGVDLNGTNKLSSRHAIVAILYTASEAVEGALVNITGTVRLAFDNAFYASEDPVISATIGFAHAAYKTDATTKWLSYNCLPTGTEFPFEISVRVNLRGELAANPIAGADKLVLNNTSSQPISDRWAGVAGETFVKNSPAITYVNPSDTSVATTELTAGELWLCLEIVMGASGTNGDINFSATYDLDTEITLP